MRRLAVSALLALTALAGAGCNLELDATDRIPPELAGRIAQKKAALTSRPDDLKTRLELGELYLEAGQHFDAAETFEAVAGGETVDPAVHGGLGEAYMELGYFPSSLQQIRECFGKNRQEPGCLYVYGRMMAQIDDPQALREAQGAYRTLLATTPDFRKAKMVASELDQIDAKVAQLPPEKRAASQPAAGPASQPAAPPPSDPAAAATPGHGGDVSGSEDVGGLNPFGQAIMKAIRAVRANDPATAEAAFAEALTIRKDDPGALAGLAEMQFLQGKTTEATANIDKAFRLDPKDAQVRWAFGRINVELRRRTDEAVAAWRSLVADDPEYAGQLGVPERLEAIDKYSGGAAPKQ